MRRMIQAVAAIALLCGVPALASEPGKCLRWNDITAMKKVAPDTVLAQTLSHDAYVIKFTAACDYQTYPDYYFIVEPQQRLACVTSQDVFHVHHAGACLIGSITAAPQAH